MSYQSTTVNAVKYMGLSLGYAGSDATKDSVSAIFLCQVKHAEEAKMGNSHS